MTSLADPVGTTTSLAPRGRAAGVVKAFNANKTSWIGLALFALICFAAIGAPFLVRHDPTEQDITAILQPPGAAHWLGTDSYGRDIWARVLYGARVSLVIGIASTAIAMVVGSLIGIVAGWRGGRVDAAMMQGMDILLAFPNLILGLIIVAMLGASAVNLTIAIAVTSIPTFARVARAPTIAIKQREYIEACRAMGLGELRIVGVHVVPNIFPEVLVIGSLWLANAIRTEASLAFIGLGVKPPTPTWGGMIREGFENLLDSAWLAVMPSLAILLTVFALNLLGDGLRDAVDPKLKNEV